MNVFRFNAALVAIIFALVGLLGNARVSFAQESLCGDPPPVKNEKISGELNGKAQFLSRFLGDAALGGRIEATRTEIFSGYPNADKTWMNAYLQYQVCLLLIKDQRMSTPEKIQELIKVRQSFERPVK